MWKRTTAHLPRMLTAMTETAASTMRIAEDGRRMHTAIRLVMEKEITQGSHLEEEELVKEKEKEEDHHHHRRPEEMDLNLVVNTDRRVSLMVMYRVPQLLKCFLLWLNVSKKPS